MNNSKNSVLDQLAQSCCETGSSVLSTEQLRSILLSAAYKVPDMPVNTEGLKKALLIFDQALKLPDDAWISFEEAKTVVDDVKPYLPPETVQSLESKMEKSKTSDHKISKEVWIGILTTLFSSLVAIILFWLGQTLPNPQLQQIIDLLSQHDVVENSDNIPETFDCPVFEIASLNQMPQNNQSKHDEENIRDHQLSL